MITEVTEVLVKGFSEMDGGGAFQYQLDLLKCPRLPRRLRSLLSWEAQGLARILLSPHQRTLLGDILTKAYLTRSSVEIRASNNGCCAAGRPDYGSYPNHPPPKKLHGADTADERLKKEQKAEFHRKYSCPREDEKNVAQFVQSKALALDTHEIDSRWRHLPFSEGLYKVH